MIFLIIDETESINGSLSPKFPEPKVTSSELLFCQINSPKPKDIQFIIMEDEENQNTHIWEARTSESKDEWIIKMVANSFNADRLINWATNGFNSSWKWHIFSTIPLNPVITE